MDLGFRVSGLIPRGRREALGSGVKILGLEETLRREASLGWAEGGTGLLRSLSDQACKDCAARSSIWRLRASCSCWFNCRALR